VALTSIDIKSLRKLGIKTNRTGEVEQAIGKKEVLIKCEHGQAKSHLFECSTIYKEL